jgi:hypothetical protein
VIRKYFFLFLLPFLVFAAEIPQTVEKVNERMKIIQDAEVELFVRSRLPEMVIPDRTGTLLFKRPDKIHLEGDGFMMIPQEALLFDFSRLQEDSTVSFLPLSPDSLKGSRFKAVRIQKVDPYTNRHSNIDVLIDTMKWAIHEVSVDEGERFKGKIHFQHTEVLPSVWLPKEVKMILAGNAAKPRKVKNPRIQRIPRADTAEDNYLLMKFSKYKINKGIADERFPEMEEE